MSTPPAIAVSKLTHRYAAERRWGPAVRPALDKVTFNVQPGEVVAMLGPNGGGKTTLFRILATMLRPNPARAGAAQVLGRDVLAEPQAVRRALGVVFQSPSLDDQLSAAENLRHQGRLHGLRGDDLTQRISHWLERFGLTDRANDRVGRFSGGMRRRVELAKALLHEPGLLLMDEPSTGLDPAGRRDLWRHIERLRRDHGVTVAFTTHLMAEAERCDRVAILNQGKLVAYDTPARLKSRVGGEVVTIEPTGTEPNDPDRLAEQIGEYLGLFDPQQQPTVVGGAVRFEMTGATEVVADLTHEFPQRIRRLSVGQPTLEDVFLDLTGRPLDG